MKNFRRVSCDAAVTVILLLVCWLTLASLASAQTNFSIQSIKRNSDGSVTLTWPVIPEWTYFVMSSDGLTNEWQYLQGFTAGTNSVTLSYTDTQAGFASQRFYKVRGGHTQILMTLVLDRSGSMNPIAGTSQGGQYLPQAVIDFVNQFDDNFDEVAMVSFSSTANVDVPMGRPFKSAIATAVNSLQYVGGTFAQGGLVLALTQNNSVAIPPGQSVFKIVVYITDGEANIVQQTLDCGVTLNFGGYDLYPFVSFWDPATPENSPDQGSPSCTIEDNSTLFCFGCVANQFLSSYEGDSSVWFTRANVSDEAGYEAIQTANQLRYQGVYVFAVGLGQAADTNFLLQVANDPSSPTFNPSQPVGAMLIANPPSNLDAVLRQIAIAR